MSAAEARFVNLVSLARDAALRQALGRVSMALAAALLVCQVPLPVSAGNGIGEGLASLVKMAVDAMIIVGGLTLAFAFAFTGLSTIFAKMAGMPYAEATATMKVIGVVIAFIFTAFAIPVANAIIDNVMRYHSPEGIHVPSL